jgi:hypothetical protein
MVTIICIIPTMLSSKPITIHLTIYGKGGSTTNGTTLTVCPITDPSKCAELTVTLELKDGESLNEQDLIGTPSNIYLNDGSIFTGSILNIDNFASVDEYNYIGNSITVEL